MPLSIFLAFSVMQAQPKDSAYDFRSKVWRTLSEPSGLRLESAHHVYDASYGSQVTTNDRLHHWLTNWSQQGASDKTSPWDFDWSMQFTPSSSQDSLQSSSSKIWRSCLFLYSSLLVLTPVLHTFLPSLFLRLPFEFWPHSSLVQESLLVLPQHSFAPSNCLLPNHTCSFARSIAA